MASLFLLRRPLALGLGLSTAFAAHTLYRAHSRPMLCESPVARASDAFRGYTQTAQVPVVKGGRTNPNAYKQISSGSILGTYDADGWDGMDSGRGNWKWEMSWEIEDTWWCQKRRLICVHRARWRFGSLDVFQVAGVRDRVTGVWCPGEST